LLDEMTPSLEVPLSRKQKRVLYFLTDNARRDEIGQKVISVRRKQIGDATGVSPRHVAYALRRLEKLGYVTTVRQMRKDGGWDANKYVLHPLDGVAPDD